MPHKPRRRIIARRELVRTNMKGKSAKVRILIEAPQLRRNGMATCRFKIDNLTERKGRWLRIHGIDELAALLTAIHIIHVHLYYRTRRRKWKLTWIGAQDLGIPLTAGPFTNNRDAKGRIERPKKR